MTPEEARALTAYAADWKDDGYDTRIVRRYVTTPEGDSDDFDF